MVTTMVTPTPDSTKADLALCMSFLNDEAKALSRRGYVGYMIPRYAELHENLNVLITSWQQATA